MKKILYFFLSLLLIAVSCKHEQTQQKIRVGVFAGNGASPICILETLEALKIDTDIQGVSVSAVDIMRGKLDSLDVLIFPGGSGSKELNNLGISGAQKVKNFVRNGGRILGICAGGYLLSTTPTYPSLALASAKNIDRKHYSRGRGLVEFSLTDKGLQIFPELKNKRLFLQYYDGPVLAPVDSTQMNYIELARYVSDIHANKGIPSGITPGKTFMLTENIGKGKIFIVAGHPEATPGMRWMIARIVRYLYDGKIKDYSKWIRPQIYTHEIMFTSELKKKEKQFFWQLLSDTVDIRLAAMDSLHSLRSRPAVRWTIGMLRDTSALVRLKAAQILQETEYTAALPDLKQAFIDEKNPKVKAQLQKTIEFLSEF